jgi:chromate transporter
MSNREISYKELFVIFFKAGWAFGGGIGVIFAMEQELVHKRKLMPRGEFMSMYAIGRIVPSGTVTSVAIGVGYKYKKLLGTFVALLGVMLPGFTITIILAAFYGALRESKFFDLINYSIMPAAVGLIFISALNMGKDVFHSPLLIGFVVASFIATFFLGINAGLVLLAGGILGIIIFSKVKEGHDLPS